MRTVLLEMLTMYAISRIYVQSNSTFNKVIRFLRCLHVILVTHYSQIYVKIQSTRSTLV